MLTSRWFNNYPVWPRLSTRSRSLGFDDVFDDFEAAMNDLFLRDPSADVDPVFADLARDLGLPMIAAPSGKASQPSAAAEQPHVQQQKQQQQQQLIPSPGQQLATTSTDPWKSTWLSAYARAPAMDIIERGNDFLITIDLPGVNKNDIKLQLSQDPRGRHLMTVSGERKEEKEHVDKGWRSSQRLYGQFSRSIRLPDNIKQDNLQAKYENGVLKVTVPKIEQAPAAKQPPQPKMIPVA